MKKNENFKSELETQYNILIKAEEQEQKKRTFIIIAILILTLIAVIISLVFSYKTYKSSTKEVEKKVAETYYRTLNVTYNNTPRIEMPNITTGFELTTPKVISITNEGNTDITFNIKISNIITNMTSTNNLVYSITKNNEASISKELPLQDTNVISQVKIGPKETITYVISVKFNGYLDWNVSYSYGASFVVEQIDNQASLLE